MNEQLDARFLRARRAYITRAFQQLNELNVFPVPDGDTGTNMSMTINAAAGDLRKAEDPSLEKAAAIASSRLLPAAPTSTSSAPADRS